MDETDETIVALLQQDGRATHRELARRIGLSRSATASRLQHLIGSGQVLVRGVAHPSVLGNEALAHVGLTVSGPARPIAEAVAAREDVALATITSGPRAVIAELRAPSFAAVDRAVSELRGLPGVRSADTHPYVEVVRDVVGPTGAVDLEVDAIDRALLCALQEDGRASYVALGQQVGLSAAGARRRVVRLREHRLLHIGALVRQRGREPHAAMGLGIQLTSDQHRVIDRVGILPSVTFVARALGHFDVLVSMRARTDEQLIQTVEQIRGLPGINAVETWTHLDILKESYALGLTPPAGS